MTWRRAISSLSIVSDGSLTVAADHLRRGCGSSGRRGCRRCRTRARSRPRCPDARPDLRAAGSWRGTAACCAAPHRTGCRCRCRPPWWSCRTARRSRPAAARPALAAPRSTSWKRSSCSSALENTSSDCAAFELGGVLGRDDAHRRLGRVGQGALRAGAVVALARPEHRVGRRVQGADLAGAAVDAPVGPGEGPLGIPAPLAVAPRRRRVPARPCRRGAGDTLPPGGSQNVGQQDGQPLLARTSSWPRRPGATAVIRLELPGLRLHAVLGVPPVAVGHRREPDAARSTRPLREPQPDQGELLPRPARPRHRWAAGRRGARLRQRSPFAERGEAERGQPVVPVGQRGVDRPQQRLRRLGRQHEQSVRALGLPSRAPVVDGAADLFEDLQRLGGPQFGAEADGQALRADHDGEEQLLQAERCRHAGWAASSLQPRRIRGRITSRIA